MKISTICSIGVLISFFLPWFDFGFFSLSGYEFPTSLDKLISLDTFFNSANDAQVLKASYLLYLIPVSSAFNIIKDIAKIKGPYFLNEFLFGIVSIIFLYIGFTNITEKAMTIFSVGFYLTGIFSFCGLFSFRNEKYTENNSDENSYSGLKSIDNGNYDNADLLNNLSKLHSLRENSVITEEIYEQERQSILEKFQKKELAESGNRVTTPAYNVPQEAIDPVYEELFNKKSWIKRHKALFIGMVLVVFVGAFIIYKNNTLSKVIFSDWKESNLRGKVKSLIDSNYYVTEKNGEIQKGKLTEDHGLQGALEIDFDKNGNMLNENGLHIIYNFDAVGNRIEKDEYEDTAYSKLFEKETYTYDSLGHVIEIEYYSGGYRRIEKFLYDSIGNKIESEVSNPNISDDKPVKYYYKYDLAGNLVEEINWANQRITFKYDDIGNKIEQRTYFGDGKEQIEIYHYNYDNERNWIKCLHYVDGKPTFVTEREIDYY